MTLVSRSVEMLLDRDAEAARAAARPAARAPARGAGRDAGADLRAPPGQPRAGRPRPRAADAHRRAAGPDRAAGRRREHARRAAAAARRGGPLPDRPGGAPQRRQARRGPPGPARGRADRRAAVRLRIADDGKGFDPSAGPGRPSRAGRDARPGRPGSARAFAVRSEAGKGTTIEVVVPRTPRSRPCRTRDSARDAERRRSATDDVDGARRSAEAHLVERPFRVHAPAARPWADARPCVRDRPARSASLVVDADDRVRESLAGLLVHRRQARGRGRAPARPARPWTLLVDRVAGHRRSSIRACRTSPAVSRSSGGSGRVP